MTAPIFILVGPPRSGTSALAQSFHEAGIRMFTDADPPDRHSPTGNHEDRRVRLLNNLLMGRNALGDLRDWDNPIYVRSGPDGADPRIADYVGMRAAHAGGKAWGVKDPRLCFLIEPWHEATRHLPVTWIHIERTDREASIASLVKMLPAKLHGAGDPDTLYRLASSWLEAFHLAVALGFERTGVVPYRTSYETLLDPAGREEVRARFGFGGPISCIDPSLNRQGGAARRPRLTA